MLGVSVPRREDRALLTGAGMFLDDVAAAGTLEVAFLRSPVAHALLARVDASAAAATQGVTAVVTAAELALPPLHPPCTNPNGYCPPRPLLAEGRVRFVGEPIAAVVAESRYLAEDVVDAIELDLEPLAAVVDAVRAAADHDPELHAGTGTNLYLDWRHEAGDVDGVFATAAAVVERRLESPRYSAVPIEPRGCLALPDGDGVLLWSSTQTPHRTQSIVAELLGLPPASVRVRCPDVGGGFGQKAHTYPEEIVVAWLALRLGRAVKWVEDRAENMLAASHARDQQLVVRAAADADGKLLAVDADVVCDQGAYGVFPHGTILEALGTPAMIPGPYRLSAYRLRSRAVATNKCPEGAYRGVGLVVSALAHERLLDALARELALDRAEIRRRNLVTAEEMPYATVTNQRYDSGDYRRALDQAVAVIGYEEFETERARARAEGRLLGIGLASYVEFTGVGSAVFHGRGMAGISGLDGAHVELDEEGGAVVWTTTPAIGQGTETTFAQLVGAGLSLDPARVRVERTDTGVGELEGTGTFVSRSAIVSGAAIAGATAELRARLLDAASERLEIAASDLEVAGGTVRAVGAPDVFVPFAELVAARPERFRVGAHHDPVAPAYPYATHACVVEVDPDTGAVTLLRYVVVEDCGRVINPMIAHGQTIGATAQGISGALLEALVYDGDGQLLNASLMDYLVPTAGELPVLELHGFEIPSPHTANGVKGVGEGGTLGAPAAIASAVSDAIGVELDTLPITPERVLRALGHIGVAA